MKNSPRFGKLGIVFSLFAGLMLIALFSCDPKPPKNSLVAQAQQGKIHFDKYCADCHGEDGRGLRIDTLSEQPADLTRILDSRGVTDFPILQIADVIDGRMMAGAHGTRAMPIWGEVFSKEEYLTEKQIKGKMAELIAYLMSIQE